MMLCLSLSVLTAAADAAFERQLESVRALGMGGACSATGRDVWGALSNPAGCAGVPGPAFSLSCAPRPFGLKELERSAITFAGPVGFGTIAVTAVRFGFDLYREIVLGFALGIVAAGPLRGGVCVTWNHLAIAGYGSDWTAGIDAGIQWDVAANLQIGAAATNCNAPVIGRSGEQLPRSFRVGLAYAGPGGALLVCDVAKDVRFPPELRVGLEYTVFGTLALRAGAGGETCGAGFGVDVSPLTVDYAFSRHDELGFTHRLGLTVRFDGW